MTHRRRVDIDGMAFDPITEKELGRIVLQGLEELAGGLIVTPNVEIHRQARRDPSVADLVARAEIVVADGMPLVWCGRIARRRLPERVAGSQMIDALAEAAAASGVGIFLLGGTGGSSRLAAKNLRASHPGLVVTGTYEPPFGFEDTPDQLEACVRTVVEGAPGIVFVGLGFPKQERLSLLLYARLPHTWFLGCGAGIAFTAGTLARAPRWMQRAGIEWLYRLSQEPSRLFRRYLIDDVPELARILLWSLRTRLSHRADTRGSPEIDLRA